LDTDGTVGQNVDEDGREVETAFHKLRWLGTASSIVASVFLIVGVLQVRVLLICAAGAWLSLSVVSTLLTGARERRKGRNPSVADIERVPRRGPEATA
jgi:hypothetical protein